ncbi:FapA family protein [Motilimonas cestriensis]|uniref:FapA family protein n=1 Tax=Motilimonas cestriensis TaxID=2742685 RepID=A0ABS8W875_9GAMM|nr:FapA family protein [Motilimonas cestriensis]MCE2595199.1 FapA family protein [Motilimonas cestriensis]
MISPEFFKLHENNVDLLLTIEPVADIVKEEHLLMALAASPYEKFKPSAVGLAEAVKRFAKQMKNEEKTGDDNKPVIIAQRLDAVISIELDKEKMTAFANATAAWGGNRLDEDTVKEALSSAGVTYGIRINNIVALISTLNKAQPGKVIRAPVAKGLAAKNGTDTRFERLVETLKERIRKPKKLQGGKVDMRDLGALISVSKGKPLMRKHPHTLGEDGFKVTGDVIAHKEGKPLEFDVGKNTEISSKNPNYLVATQTGIPIEIDRGMIVDDVLMIPNVDVGFGHVDFDGSILIKGNICEGMKVRASGDINVGGIVESADVEAGGDLIIEKGVIGHHTDDGDHYSCHLTAHGSIEGVFAQYTKITCNGTLHFNHQLIHCDVTCFDKVEVFDAGGRKGSILGGTVRALKGVTAVNVGADAGTRTEIKMLGDLAAKYLERKVLLQEVEDEEQKLLEIGQAAAKVDQLPDSDKKTTLIHRLSLSKQHEETRIQDVKQRIETIETYIEDYLTQARLTCQGHLYSGVVFSLDEHSLTVERERQAAFVALLDNKLQISPIN